MNIRLPIKPDHCELQDHIYINDDSFGCCKFCRRPWELIQKEFNLYMLHTNLLNKRLKRLSKYKCKLNFRI